MNRNRIAMGFILLSGVYFAGVRLTELHRLRAFPTTALEEQLRQIRSMLSSPVVVDQADTFFNPVEMSREARWISIELRRRFFKTDAAFFCFGLLGLALLMIPPAFSYLWGKRDWRTFPRGEDDVGIQEAPPREEYVDDWDYSRKVEGAFKNREAAIDWLLKDPLKKCDYCGSDLHPSYPNEGDSLQLVTFYKKVPEGAVDLRIVLGSHWFTREASQLQCKSCRRAVVR